MSDTTTPEGRTAPQPTSHAGSVTLINLFVVDPERDDDFMQLWTEISRFMRAQPGFVSLRFHRAVSPDAHYRYANVAVWESVETFRAAHENEEFQRLVRKPEWAAFPSSPTLYEVIVDHAVAPSVAA